MRVYLLTGATGVVGSEVLDRLLDDADVRVYVLMRDSGHGIAKQRLAALLEYFDRPVNSILPRISIVEGDIERPGLGISAQQYREITHRVTHVIHCAGNVKSNLPEDKARSIAVGSVRSVIDLANEALRAGSLEKIDVVSTVGVAGRESADCIEGRLGLDREFHNTYELAKAEAEQVVWAAIDEGLPATLHRPSMIVGDTMTGRVHAFQVFYYICEFVSGVRTAGLLPDFSHAALDIVPVDYVAEAIIWSSQHLSTSGKVLHLSSGAERSLSLSELQQRLRLAFARAKVPLPRRKQMPMGLFRVLVPLITLFAPKDQKRRLRTLGFFLDYLSESHDFVCTETEHLLGASGITKPDSNNYVDVVLDYYLQRRGQ